MTFFCPGIDVEEFQADCRIPLHRNQWNHWKIWRTDRDSPSDKEVLSTTENVLGKWFEHWGKIEKISTSLSSFPNEDGSRPSTLARKEHCPHPTLVKADNPILVYARFIYRGSHESMPLPVWKAQVYEPWCPVDADYIVDKVYTPIVKEVPEEEISWYEPGGEITPDLPTIIDPTRSISGALLWTGVGLGVVIITSRALR